MGRLPKPVKMRHAVLRVGGQLAADLDSAPLQRTAQAIDRGVESADALLRGRRKKQNLHGCMASVSR